ncbi:MAG: hypothetical protein ACP5GS_06865 [Nitrososphaeria archaeon]
MWEATVPLNLSKKPSVKQNIQSETIYDIDIGSAVLKVFYNGKPILQSFVELFNTQLNFTDNLIFKIIVPIQTLQFIEAQRQDDIKLEFQIVGTYLIYQQNIPQTKALKQFSLPFNQTYSQKNWLNLLRETGYSDKWIIEIDRPKIEGFNEVLVFLDKAGNKLLEKNDPPGVLTELRKTWKALDPLIQSKEDEINKKIDRGSRGEPNHPQKSQRIEEIRKAVINFVQIGPHEEGYNVTYSDALLAYRLFISLLQYYSELISEADK